MIEQKKKIIGALLAGCLVILYYGALLFITAQAGLFSDQDIPRFIVIIILVAFLIPVIGVTVALVSRMQEISSGEEEEAKKY